MGKWWERKGKDRGNDEKGKDRGNDEKGKERIGEMMRKERIGDINVYNFRDSLFSIEFF